jgi:hypothetical protein
VAILVGEDDRLLCEISHPPLSAIDLGSERIGYEAAALLDCWRQNGLRPKGRRTFLRCGSPPVVPRTRWPLKTAIWPMPSVSFVNMPPNQSAWRTFSVRSQSLGGRWSNGFSERSASRRQRKFAVCGWRAPNTC